MTAGQSDETGLARPTGSKQPIDLPLRKAMPKPLLILFALLNVAALTVAVVLLLRPAAFETTPLAERRPPPSGSYSHHPGRVAPAPAPTSPPTLPPPCEAFANTRLVMSGDGVLRVREALSRLCRLADGGIGAELGIAIRGLASATIRFGQFEVSALESTLGVRSKTIWLNVRFARRGTPVEHLLPPLIHEAYHIGSNSLTPGAFREVEARRAELDACKQLIARAEWPRWCRDAEEIATMPIDDAIALLRAAGYSAT